MFVRSARVRREGERSAPRKAHLLEELAKCGTEHLGKSLDIAQDDKHVERERVQVAIHLELEMVRVTEPALECDCGSELRRSLQYMNTEAVAHLWLRAQSQCEVQSQQMIVSPPPKVHWHSPLAHFLLLILPIPIPPHPPKPSSTLHTARSSRPVCAEVVEVRGKSRAWSSQSRVLRGGGRASERGSVDRVVARSSDERMRIDSCT